MTPNSALRILLVEDSASDAALLRESLAEAGPGRFEVTHVDSWTEAAARLQSGQFDVLLLDLSLPDTLGRDTFLRARVAAPSMPIVILTGMTDEAIALDAMRHGIQDYLVKGQTDGAQVARAIRYAIERNRAEEALKQTQAALREANQELERRVAARTAQLEEVINNLEDFSHSVTHDLRAPLRAIRAFAQFLCEECGASATPQTLDYAQRIITAVARMDKLIVDVLQYSRTARSELHLGPVDVSPLLRGIIESYPAFAPPVEIRLQEPLPHVQGNEAVLTQCFSNLLGNAVKFVAPGVAPHIRVWAEERGDGLVDKWISGLVDKTTGGSQEHSESTPPPINPSIHQSTHPPIHSSGPTVRIWVEDNGIGIPKQAHERIFELFQRLDKSYDGTGAGLAIVRKAVERMGGRVGVESEPGRGSRFWLDLKPANPLTEKAL
jgi:signal transduction histidine kinase